MHEEIDGCSCLYLEEAHEPRTNALVIVVAEGLPLGPARNLDIGGATVPAATSIGVTDASRRFELLWTSYISYAVHNEMYQAADEAELYEGKHLRRFSKSRFAALVRRSSAPIAELPPHLQHWNVLCEWHVVDVIAHGAPRVRRLPSK